jgi:hypothetical protein
VLFQRSNFQSPRLDSCFLTSKLSASCVASPTETMQKTSKFAENIFSLVITIAILTGSGF